MTKSIDLQYPYLPLPKKKANCFFVVACILYVVYALVLLPHSEYVGSNIIFEGTFLYVFLSFLCTAVELTAFCWVFSCLITSRFAYGAAASVKILLIYALALLVRYVLTLLVSWKMEGMSGSDLLFELIFMLIYILLDMTQAAIVLMLVHMLRKKQDAVYHQLKKHLTQFFQTPVQLTCSAKGSGKISIKFKDEQELERIISIFDKLNQ